MSIAALSMLLLVLLLAWVTAAATALRSVSRIWLRHWVERGLAGATSAEIFLERPQRLLAAASAGAALIVLLTGMLVGWSSRSDPLRITGTLLVIAAAMLVCGQLLPRAIARRWAARLMPLLLPLLQAIAWLVSPLVRLARAVSRPLCAPGVGAGAGTRDGISDLLREGELEGIGAREELRIITGVVEFGEKTLKDVMTPRTDVFAIPIDLPPREAAQAIAQGGFSRVPVYRDSLDEIVGIVHVFDVLREAGERMPALRPVGHAPASKRCSEMLFEMLRGQRHLSVVLDEHGGTAGIVTLEDVLEELVGDIRDEHDEPMSVDAAALPRALLVDAGADWDATAARFHAAPLSGIPTAARSVGGVLVRTLGRIPGVGERFRLGDLELTVVSAEPARVQQLLVQRAETAAPVELAPLR